MTVQDLLHRFPEIPGDLHQEPLLEQLADRCGELLEVARRPSNCSPEHDAANHYYLKLIGPLSIHGFGLSTREKGREQIQQLLDQQAANPGGFPASLLPPDTADREVRGPGCE